MSAASTHRTAAPQIRALHVAGEVKTRQPRQSRHRCNALALAIGNAEIGHRWWQLGHGNELCDAENEALQLRERREARGGTSRRNMVTRLMFLSGVLASAKARSPASVRKVATCSLVRGSKLSVLPNKAASAKGPSSPPRDKYRSRRPVRRASSGMSSRESSTASHGKPR